MYYWFHIRASCRCALRECSDGVMNTKLSILTSCESMIDGRYTVRYSQIASAPRAAQCALSSGVLMITTLSIFTHLPA